jgi:ubiquinone/menaquinone biosynthesis C-methylase UbiE
MTAVFDVAAAGFDRHRALPADAAGAIRAAILAVAGGVRPRLLDLGAGTGRLGRALVAAGDDYVGVDRSRGMLAEFARKAEGQGGTPCLVQADGEHLPFRDASFDAVLLIQIFGGLAGWQRLLQETRRVLRPAAALVVGRTVGPGDGVDTVMKRQLATLLEGMAVQRRPANCREEALCWLAVAAEGGEPVVAARWPVERSPRKFLERHAAGAQFAALPGAVRDVALGRLATWAEKFFGSLDAKFSEPHGFELRVFRFKERIGVACPS